MPELGWRGDLAQLSLASDCSLLVGTGHRRVTLTSVHTHDLTTVGGQGVYDLSVGAFGLFKGLQWGRLGAAEVEECYLCDFY